MWLRLFDMRVDCKIFQCKLKESLQLSMQSLPPCLIIGLKRKWWSPPDRRAKARYLSSKAETRLLASNFVLPSLYTLVFDDGIKIFKPPSTWNRWAQEMKAISSWRKARYKQVTGWDCLLCQWERIYFLNWLKLYVWNHETRALSKLRVFCMAS